MLEDNTALEAWEASDGQTPCHGAMGVGAGGAGIAAARPTRRHLLFAYKLLVTLLTLRINLPASAAPLSSTSSAYTWEYVGPARVAVPVTMTKQH